MRPIIPCHSAIMNPAAKFVSKKLKPLIQGAPTILHGSKDLAIKLSQVTLSTTKHWYIVTGDVVAFYPNIPLNRCLEIITELYTQYLMDTEDINDPVINTLLTVFIKCLSVGNTRLVCQFQKEYYEQLQGLAMGVADSPDLANLYGYYFERTSGILSDERVPFYGRYIDDCLAIVYAESAEEASTYLSNRIKFENCTILWDAAKSQPFLDMLLYQNRDNELEYKPYQKARNHRERIPWISHHPLDVKRGTFISELSRLATLSSNRDHYKDAVHATHALYVARGYPNDLVVGWARSYAQERWEKRLTPHTPSGEDAGVLVLKTEYNEAWNYFNAKELGDQIFSYWREWLERAERGNFDMNFPPPIAGDHGDIDGSHSKEWIDHEGCAITYYDMESTNIMKRRMLLSRKRTKNLLNLTNLWKKVVLQNLDERVLPNQNQAIEEELIAGPSQQRPRPDLEITPVVENYMVRNNVDIDNDSDNEVEPVWAVDRSSRAPRNWSFSGHVERTDVNRGGGW